MGITNLEQNIINKETWELLRELKEFEKQERTNNEEYILIKKELRKRGDLR